MKNAELIKALRRCSYETVAGADREDGYCKPCAYFAEDTSDITCIDRMMIDAADALEAADEKIADYTAAIDALDDSNDAYIKENERLKKRIAELEAQIPKEGCWIPNSPFTGNCSECGGAGNLKDKYCASCGARMRGEHDGES